MRRTGYETNFLHSACALASDKPRASLSSIRVLRAGVLPMQDIQLSFSARDLQTATEVAGESEFRNISKVVKHL
jgi:hypothetical protein